MKFKKYQHIEYWGNIETDGIEFGTCYVFPKIDGTNGSVWNYEGEICAGSRNRELTLDKDNQGFLSNILHNKKIEKFLLDFPDLKLFGEWLVPHSLRTYQDDAWKKFYVFDVVKEVDDKVIYLPYKEYSPMLSKYNINYIPPIAIIKNPTYKSLVKELENNKFLIKDGEGTGEGIVIKNYDYTNRFGRQTWAKIVTNKFKEKHNKTMGAPVKETKHMIEQKIVDDFVDETLIEKEYQKIINENDGWSSKFIPRLLNTIFYCLIKEESWNFLKKHKFPKIDFKTLRIFTYNKVKKIKKELF